MNADYWLAVLDRAVKTAAQSAILSVGVETAQVNALAVDWTLLGGMALGGFVLSVLSSLATSGIRGNGPSTTTERVVRTTTRHVPLRGGEGGYVDPGNAARIVVGLAALALVVWLLVLVF